MNKVRFFVSWIVSSLVMFGASYLWHGIFLTDFSRINYPFGVFLTAACLVYLFLGFLVSKGFNIQALSALSKKPILKGLIIGMVIGASTFILTLVAGVSFSNQLTMKSLLLDLSWQIAEQAIGGITVGIVHYTLAGNYVYHD